jgi:NAD(P)H-flavin reductase
MDDPYIPKKAKILEVIEETADIRTYKLENVIGSHAPGQFVELTIWDVGEAPISISSLPGELVLSVKRIGSVTGALFGLKAGDTVGVRGPYGHGWPMEKLSGKNIILVCGGVGLPPLRPIIYNFLKQRKNETLTLCYGARSPEDMVYRKELEWWAKQGISVNTTVDTCGIGWNGNVGVVTCIMEKAVKKDDNAICLMCGPPVMMKYASRLMVDKGFSKEQVYLSMENLMKCGVGKCGNCMAGGKYVCKDGPVFRMDELEKLPEKMV